MTRSRIPRPPGRPQDAPRPYRRTLLDKMGPDFGYTLKAVGWSCAGALIPALVVARYAPAGPFVKLLVLAPLAYLLSAALLTVAALALMRLGAAIPAYYIAPTGASTPYEEQFSREEALVMQGRAGEALASFERRIAADPLAIAARIRAADLYATHGADPARAAELFRDVQRLPGLTSGQDAYVGNRLADLYLGPLQTPERALVELRRLLDRYPDSRVAPQLRQAIASLKRMHGPHPPAP